VDVICDIITRRRRNTPDTLFEFLNSYNPRINLTVEVDPNKFLDIKFVITANQACRTEVFRKETKVTAHWPSSVPKMFKRNAINGDLSRAERISSDVKTEKLPIWSKYETADYPPAFVKVREKRLSILHRQKKIQRTNIQR